MGVFAARLREARRHRKYTQKELAERLGVAPSTVGHYETGEREPDAGMLTRIADVLNVSVDWLLGRSNDPQGGREPSDDEVLENLDSISGNELDRVFDKYAGHTIAAAWSDWRGFSRHIQHLTDEEKRYLIRMFIEVDRKIDGEKDSQGRSS